MEEKTSDSFLAFMGVFVLAVAMPLVGYAAYETGVSNGTKAALIKHHLARYVFDGETGEAKFEEIVAATPAAHECAVDSQ